jgi:hypothetical protein
MLLRQGNIFWFVIAFGVFLVGATSYGLHYFILTDNYLIVRNHNFFWKNDVYRLSDIKKISFEQQGRSPNFMRIITNDFKMKVYLADSLNKKHWNDLKENLLAKGILVKKSFIA